MERGPSAQSVPLQPVNVTGPDERPFMMDGFPTEFIAYFNVSPNNLTDVSKRQLTEIYEFIKSDEKSMGDILKELRATESKFGSTTYEETRFSRLWHYMKLTRQIIDLEKQKEAMHDG